MRRQRGFSLIELLIVVGIILVIAALAVPNITKSKIAANESSAVASIHTINRAMIAYSSTYPELGYSPDLTHLGPSSSGITDSNAAGLLDNVLSSGSKSGYSFVISADGSSIPVTVYEVNANPLQPDVTGHRYFFSEATGVIRCNINGSPATINDSPI